MTTSLTQRVTTEAIQTAGTYVRLATDLNASGAEIAWDQERPPSSADSGFAIADTIAVDCRIIGQLDPSRKRWILHFVRANITPNASDVTWEWMDQALSFGFTDTYDASVELPGTVDLWLAGVRQAIEDSFGPANTDGIATIIDWDGDGDDDAIVIDLNAYDEDGVDMEWDCLEIVVPTGTTLWYEPTTVSARVWLKSAVDIPASNADSFQTAMISTWCLAADLGAVGTSYDQRCSFPARSNGWIELYDLTDPSTYATAITGATPQALVLGVLLPAVSP